MSDTFFFNPSPTLFTIRKLNERTIMKMAIVKYKLETFGEKHEFEHCWGLLSSSLLSKIIKNVNCGNIFKLIPDIGLCQNTLDKTVINTVFFFFCFISTLISSIELLSGRMICFVNELTYNMKTFCVKCHKD